MRENAMLSESEVEYIIQDLCIVSHKLDEFKQMFEARGYTGEYVPTAEMVGDAVAGVARDGYSGPIYTFAVNEDIWSGHRLSVGAA